MKEKISHRERRMKRDKIAEVLLDFMEWNKAEFRTTFPKLEAAGDVLRGRRWFWGESERIWLFLFDLHTYKFICKHICIVLEMPGNSYTFSK
jgi:hypothetical protein